MSPYRMGWLPKTRVRQIGGGRSGTVVDQHPGELRLYPRPLVAWDGGQTTAIDGRDLERSPDDWLSRAVTS